jgi:transcriptional regulator with XRE-family HTH domain
MLARGGGGPDHLRMGRLADNLRYLLDKAELSENALADKTGVPQPTINRILRGQSRDPRDSTLEPIAKFFRVSVEALRRRYRRGHPPSRRHPGGAGS